MSVKTTRTILHADMDAFFAAVEQRDRPELRGKPVIVGGDRPRSVVSTCSYEARRFGVHSAMPGTTARKRCPEGVFLPVRSDVYSQVSRQIMEVFHRYTPLVEAISLDEAFMDVTASRTLFGDGVAVARAIKADVYKETRLTISVGVAPCKYVAKVASDLDKPDGLVVVNPDEVEGFLAPLPVSFLWGAGKRIQDRMKRLGLKTIGDVQRCTLEELKARFGQASGLHYANLSRGLDNRPVVTGHVARSVSHESTFDTDLIAREDCHAVLTDLCGRVGRRIRRDGRLTRSVRLKLRYGGFKTVFRQKTVVPTHDDFFIAKTARNLFDQTWDDPRGIRLLGVTAGNLVQPGESFQTQLFQEDGKTPERLLKAIDAIRDRYGRQAIRHHVASLEF